MFVYGGEEYPMPELKERLWATLPHIPVITIIWTSYLLYRSIWSNQPFPNFNIFHITDVSSLPITPVLLTFCSLPIGLSIMHLKRRSSFVHDNAEEVYQFNIWLLKAYSIMFLAVFAGFIFKFSPLIMAAGIVALAISILCIIQAIIAINTSLRGHVFHYWYPWKKDF
jgi:hypothetical protein